MSRKNNPNKQNDYEFNVRTHGSDTANRNPGTAKDHETLEYNGDSGMRVCLLVLMLISSVVMTIITH